MQRPNDGSVAAEFAHWATRMRERDKERKRTAGDLDGEIMDGTWRLVVGLAGPSRVGKCYPPRLYRGLS